MVAVLGYVTGLSKEYEVTELKCIWQDATTQTRSQPHGYVQYTAIHQLILCGTDISCVKPKIALAKVNWAHMWSPVRPQHATQTAIFPRKKKNPRSWGTTNEKFHIHQQCRESLLGRKETQDRGSEHKNHTTAFQVAHKEVPNQAGFLPGCSTSPQFLKPSNSTKTWSILSYRRVLASPLHTAQTTQAGGKTQKLYQRPDSKWQLRWVREEKKEI